MNEREKILLAEALHWKFEYFPTVSDVIEFCLDMDIDIDKEEANEVLLICEDRH